MKKVLIIIMLLVFYLMAFSQVNDEINLGRMYFPKAFVHAGKDFNKGVYLVKFGVKENVPYFFVYNKKKELLFEEMAVVKPYEGKYKKFKYRVKKELLKGYEYFRIKITKPDNLYMAYFLIKKK